MFEAKLKFEERFYCWSAKDWDRELNSNFNFLRAIKYGINARRVIRVLDLLEPSQLLRLTKVLAKRSVPEDVLERCSESLTEHEKQLIENFIELIQKESWREAAQIPPGGFQNEKGQSQFRKNVLKKAVVSELSHVLGDEYDNCEGGDIIYNTPIGSWKLVTFIDFGGRAYNLCYFHNIVNHQGDTLIENVSILRWLGICGETKWHDLKNEFCQEVAETLATIIGHFLKAAKELLVGLPNN